MKDIILQIDQMLAMLEVRGNSVLILADARKIAGEAYKLAEEMEAAKKDAQDGKTPKQVRSVIAPQDNDCS